MYPTYSVVYYSTHAALHSLPSSLPSLPPRALMNLSPLRLTPLQTSNRSISPPLTLALQ